MDLFYTGLGSFFTPHVTQLLNSLENITNKNISLAPCKLVTQPDGSGKTWPARENRCLDTGDGGNHVPGSLNKLYTP